MRYSILALGLITSFHSEFPNMARSQEIGFVEDFALASDREKILQNLIPGTEDYFFYQTLHHQNIGKLSEAKGFLDSWISKLGQSPKAREMRIRNMLLSYPEAPQPTLDFLKSEFGINLDHLAPQRDEAAHLPTKLDSALIEWNIRFMEAVTSGNRLEQIEDFVLGDALALIEYQPDFRSWIGRVQRPDLPGLVDVIVKELKQPDSQGFGWANIHRNLTLEQLDQIRKKLPVVIEVDAFVQAYLFRLQPSDDVTLTDPIVRREQLTRLESFADELPESQNSLKAVVLYHRLKHDLADGILERSRFLKYLALPRQMGYINVELARQQSSRTLINFSQDFSATTTLKPIGDDSELIQSYLEHFFQSDKDFDTFGKFLDRNFLKRVFASTKILYGLGDAKTYYAQLKPEQQKELQERIELRFLPNNQQNYAPADRIQLAVSIKNVPQLILKIYRLNAKNILQTQASNVSTAIDLDGLVANIERTIDFSQANDRRHNESLEFPELEGRGVWVVDLLGGGQRSRALIQKGQLRSLSSISDAGHLLRIVDEEGKPVSSARVKLGEREFSPTEDGAIVIPFASAKETRPLILTDGNFASLEQFTHLAEEYQLNTGFLVEPQSLRPGAKTAVVIRAQLTCNGTRMPISLVENPQLTITATDQDGIQTSQTFNNLELSETLEVSQAFLVPQRLVSLSFALNGKVHNLSQAIRQPLGSGQTIAINGVASSSQIGDFFLVKHASGFQLEVRGRNGEPLSRLPIQMQIKLQGIRNPVNVRLASDATAVAHLGELSSVERIWASADGLQQREFTISETWLNWPVKLHLLENQIMELAWPETKEFRKPDLQRFSLLEYRAGQVFAEWSHGLRVANGKLTSEKLRAGGYRLTDHQTGNSVEIDVTQGVLDGRFIVSRNKVLEANPQNGASVTKTLIEDGKVKIQLSGHDAATRVHLLATTFDRSLSEVRSMVSVLSPLQRSQRSRVPSFYLDSMRLDEEYQYVLQRQLAKKYPGNMLPQPSVLLNPWELSITTNESQLARGGDAMGNMAAAAPMPSKAQADFFAKSLATGAVGASSYDFLLRGSLVVSNLRPNEKGQISIESDVLEGLTNVIAIVVHPDGTTYSRIALTLDKPYRLFDHRLAKAFDQERKLAERQRVRILAAGEKSDLGEAISTRVRVYSSLAEVYSLYTTYLNQNVDFVKFQVIQRWPSLTDAEKQIHYGTLECHEMNLFLYFHDRPFFDRVVKPYLANKLEKQFIDEWLLGNDLSQFSQPWRLARMNSAERALFANRLPTQLGPTSRWFKDSLATRPEASNPAIHSLRFGTAMLGDALNAEGEQDKSMSKFADFDSRSATARVDLSYAFNANGLVSEAESLHDEMLREQLGLKNKLEDAPASAGKEKLSREKRSLSRHAGVAIQLYRSLEATRKWAETQYFHVPLSNQNTELARVNAFWRDFVDHPADKPFLSEHLDAPVSSLSEALMALAVMQLPIESKAVELAVEEGRLVASHPTPSVAYIQSIETVDPAAIPTSILVGQDIYLVSPSDASQAKPVQDKPILINVAYRATVVLTNPSSTNQRVQILTQIPQGAIPLSNGKMVRGTTIELGPYSSQQISYDFYFPSAGSFAHYGAQVSNDSGHLASATSSTLTVLAKPDSVDETTWAYVAAWGTNEQVLSFLNKANLQQLDLSVIAWRLQDRAFFKLALDLLTRLGRFDSTLWAYSVKHNESVRLTEWLENFAPITQSVGPVFKSQLLKVEPVERFAYQHLDFRPMVVARIHQLGNKRLLLNDGLALQYKQFLDCMAYQPTVDNSQRLSLVYYLLIQNRIEEAMHEFDLLEIDAIEQDLQYDYFAATFEFYREQYDSAVKRALKYTDYPQPRWRDWFAQVRSHVATRNRMQQGEPNEDPAFEDWKTDEQQSLLSGARESIQMKSSDKLPILDLVDESGAIKANYRNVDQLTVNYYLMDIELLFSRKPFVQHEGARLSSIEPNHTEKLKLLPGSTSLTLSIPDALRNRNMVLEVEADGLVRSHVVYANSLTVTLSSNMGRLQTVSTSDRKPLTGAYVKVYARHQDGSSRFYKDGYTDLRGQFDYASLSTNDMETTQRFSILVLHPEHGAIIREVDPPKK